MIPIMLALLCAGIAAVVFVVEPAHREYGGTRADEIKLRREIAHEEEERARLEVLARGLDEDPRVIERVQRNLGLGKPGEIRYVRPSQGASNFSQEKLGNGSQGANGSESRPAK